MFQIERLLVHGYLIFYKVAICRGPRRIAKWLFVRIPYLETDSPKNVNLHDVTSWCYKNHSNNIITPFLSVSDPPPFLFLYAFM